MFSLFSISIVSFGIFCICCTLIVQARVKRSIQRKILQYIFLVISRRRQKVNVHVCLWLARSSPCVYISRVSERHLNQRYFLCSQTCSVFMFSHNWILFIIVIILTRMNIVLFTKSKYKKPLKDGISVPVHDLTGIIDQQYRIIWTEDTFSIQSHQLV